MMRSGAPHGLGTWRNGIHLCRVDEVDTGIQRHVELLEGLPLGVLFAEGHGTQAQCADLDFGVGQGAVLHRLHSRLWCRSNFMEFSGELFPTSWLWFFGACTSGCSSRALRWADWRRLTDQAQLNVFLGAVVCVLMLWTLRTEVQPGFAWHLSGMVTLTLMFGWSLAIIAGSLALFATTIVGLNDWSGLMPSALVFIVLPATLTQVTLGLVRAYLPKHYFVYVFINAFFAGGLVAVLVAFTATGLLLAADAYSLNKLTDSYLLFLPLMFFPEAVLNGWLISIMVGFKPQWVGSFRDEEYLNGK